MNTCISRETLQLVGPSCAELGAGWSLLALDQLNSNVKKEVKSLAGYLDLSCPYIRRKRECRRLRIIHEGAQHS